MLLGQLLTLTSDHIVKNREIKKRNELFADICLPINDYAFPQFWVSKSHVPSVEDRTHFD